MLPVVVATTIKQTDKFITNAGSTFSLFIKKLSIYYLGKKSIYHNENKQHQ
jgi:hypothetical protein